MEDGNSATGRENFGTSRVRFHRRDDASKDIRVHYSDGRTGRLRISTTNQHTKKETGPSDIALERQRKAKERYKSLIRSSRYITQKGVKPNQEQQRRRHRTFFDENPNSRVDDIPSDPPSVELTPKTSNMKEELAVTDVPRIYRWNSSSVIAYDSSHAKPNKDIATTATVQTTSISTELSECQSPVLERREGTTGHPAVVSPSSSNDSHSDRIIIETEVSNLTESPSLEKPNRVHKATSFYKDIMATEDHVLESIARLQEIERKRCVVRDQRFGLEQRLHSFRRVLVSIPETIAEGEEDDQGESKEVVNWKYKIGENQILYYTGRLDAKGRPNDSNALLRFGDDQIYKGGVRNGRRHGSGTNQWPDGQTYSGEWCNDSRNGRGTHIWRDGRTVTGTWKDGHLHGNIYFRWPNGAVFDGSACMGKKEGKGVTSRPDGTVYNGNYSKGKEDGFGTLIRPDGAKYRGEFKKGLKEGYGVMLWPTQTYYGEWSNDKPHGQGRVVWSNGAIFTGQFREGTYSGMGVYVWPSGKKFVGKWEKGVKHGHGVHTWPSGQVYDGGYANGAREGYGRMTWPDGSMYCGGFHRNRRCGRGIQTDSSGALVHCGLWKHDRPCEAPDHDVLYVVRSSGKKEGEDEDEDEDDDKNPLALQDEVEEEGNEEHSEVSEENLSLPSLPSLAPAIVTPREEHITSCDDVGFPRSRKEDFAVEAGAEAEVEGPFDERVSSSSRDELDLVYRRVSPAASITPEFHERITI